MMWGQAEMDCNDGWILPGLLRMLKGFLSL
jgi:hypothetical protein